MLSVASQLLEEVPALAQSDGLEDAREICADGTYFPNNLHILEAVQTFCSVQPGKASLLLQMWSVIWEPEFKWKRESRRYGQNVVIFERETRCWDVTGLQLNGANGAERSQGMTCVKNLNRNRAPGDDDGSNNENVFTVKSIQRGTSYMLQNDQERCIELHTGKHWYSPRIYQEITKIGCTKKKKPVRLFSFFNVVITTITGIVPVLWVLKSTVPSSCKIRLWTPNVPGRSEA